MLVGLPEGNSEGANAGLFLFRARGRLATLLFSVAGHFVKTRVSANARNLILHARSISTTLLGRSRVAPAGMRKQTPALLEGRLSARYANSQ